MNLRLAARAPFLALACLLLAACSEQPLPEGFADYAGHWRGDSVLLVITPEGHGDYEYVRAGSRISIEGPVHGFDGEGFRIGFGPMSARFEVQQPPHLSDGRWRMTVDGHRLVRVDILPVTSGRDSLRL
ncbi:hypothetical protein [Arenimonas caeni]|jgi:hypothetical protein|uniref:Uncharacterized protein n=1 Tax=Arenimonas caeni TaxID=2058085 RepID=A0A2P6MCC9_9GAMM|nr:hypothetical protein [Arenimonas caeni]MDY0021139.1 hypothetical protein [Arenimonas caeni]PRH83642.1 hypothetical protein C6N40_00405 [Arenimonas caeni]